MVNGIGRNGGINFNINSTSNCARGISKSAGGFYWSYKKN